MTFDRMLVTTDLSERSRGACLYAAELANRLGVPATFLHVDELVEAGFSGSDELEAYLALASDVRREGAEQLRAALADAGLGDHELVIVPGDAHEAVLSYADEHGFPLIVAARRSRLTLEERLVGSTTRKLLRESTVPVLIVPTDAPGFVAGRELGPVVAPTDLHDISRLGVKLGRELAAAIGTSCLAVNVLDWPSVADLMVSAPNDLLTRVARRMKLNAIEQLRAHLAPLGVPESRQRVINGPSPAEAIAELAESVDASLIVVPATSKGPFKRFFLGSTSERLVKVASRPVLVLPQRWLAGQAEVATEGG